MKTLTDPAAGSVDFTHVKNSTVTKLGKIHSTTHTASRRPEEKVVYRIKVILDSLPNKKLGFKIEPTDSDIHLAVRDAAGKTMIVEFPNAGCTAGAKKLSAMKKARAALIAACGPTEASASSTARRRLPVCSSSISSTTSAGCLSRTSSSSTRR